MSSLSRRSLFVLSAIAVAGLLATLRPTGNRPGDLIPAASRESMPNVTLPDLHGQQWQFSSARGRVLLVNFWATWCLPCVEETPDLIRLAQEYGAKGVSVVGISQDEGGPETVRAFVAQHQIPYPILLPQATSSLANVAEVLPTTILVDRQGKIAKRYRGLTTHRVLAEDIDELLREPVSAAGTTP